MTTKKGPGGCDAEAFENCNQPAQNTAIDTTPATRGSAEVMEGGDHGPGWAVYDWNDSGSSGYLIGIFATKREADAAARAWAAEYGRGLVL